MPLKHVNVYLPFLLLSSKLFPDISFEMLWIIFKPKYSSVLTDVKAKQIFCQ
jgi:hypothetical protein